MWGACAGGPAGNLRSGKAQVERPRSGASAAESAPVGSQDEGLNSQLLPSAKSRPGDQLREALSLSKVKASFQKLGQKVHHLRAVFLQEYSRFTLTMLLFKILKP